MCFCKCHLEGSFSLKNCCLCTTEFGPTPTEQWGQIFLDSWVKGIEKTETLGKVSASSEGGKTILTPILPKCKVVMADPPWKFTDKLDKTRTLSRVYSTLTTDEICNIDISGVMDDSSVLLLWVPNSMLIDGLTVMSCWGYTYKTNFVWIKPRMGMGHTFRSAHETLLLGLKGKRHVVKYKGQPSWAFMPVQDHSHKPEEVYDIVERMFDGPYLEMFARRVRTGWLAYGDQIA